MLISKKEIEQLSNDVRRIIDGQAIDLRNNREGRLSILKNEIHTLASRLNEQAATLQKEKKALANALADISHQIKTPLTSMIIMADLIENAPEDKQTEFISNLKTTLRRADWLVSSILKMAKLESGAIEFSKETVPSLELINLALEPLQILLEVKGQSVEIHGNAEFNCDKRWTAEAFTNIIKNASEYSPNGGIIRIEVGANPLCDWVRVTDSGAGITINEVPTLFKKFQGSRSEKGYGLGLPLALAVMKEQNGDIEVDGGDDGKGSTFTLKLFK